MLTFCFLLFVVVFISSRNQKQCDDAAAELNTRARDGGKVIALPAVDLSKVEDARKLATVLRAELVRLRGYEGLDVLVHNSGMSWGEPFEAFSEQGWDRVMDL
jgi:NAD(P)-dependent dehydrogenase (short-subunit alcohol dehydrogenase family)